MSKPKKEVTTKEEKILPGGPSEKRTKARIKEDGKTIAEGTASGTDDDAKAAARKAAADDAAAKREED